jgi:hypothetical protein
MVARPMLLAAVLAVVYLIWAPPSADLAAQEFRVGLWEEHGFEVWSNAWYAGFHVPGYSLLFPPLAAALGARLVGALSAVAAAGLFGALVAERYGSRGRLAALWFGAATATNLFTGRLTFALGVAIGLAALLALQRSRAVLATALAVLTSLASPVAGLFLAIAGSAVAIARRPGMAGRGPAADSSTWLGGAAIAFWALLAIVAMAVAFPTGGIEPFVWTAFAAVPLFTILALILIPGDSRTLRWGVFLYALAAVVLFIVDTPVGGNVTRLGALFAGPVIALALGGRRPLLLAILAVPLVWWQWTATVRDLGDAVGDPSTERAYHAPLVERLDRLTGGAPVRIHVPPTRNRWEAAYVAPRYPLARGWLRQLESDDFDLFQDGNLTADAYRDWLDERGVSYVALPDAELDYLATDEAELIRAGLPYLREVWSDKHWTLYEVVGEPTLVEGEAGPTGDARVIVIDPQAFEMTVSRPGAYAVRIRHSPYWAVTRGDACVERAGEWTRVQVREPSVVRVEAKPSLAAALGRESHCSA